MEKFLDFHEEAKKRWGHTDAWKQSQEHMKNWTEADFERVKKEGDKILQDIVAHMDKGVEDSDVQKCIAQYHIHMNNFYDCQKEMYRELGKMYSEDERFAAFFEKIQPGLANFMTQAIEFYCEQQ